jgi:hypothetical protein
MGGSPGFYICASFPGGGAAAWPGLPFHDVHASMCKSMDVGMLTFQGLHKQRGVARVNPGTEIDEKKKENARGSRRENKKCQHGHTNGAPGIAKITRRLGAQHILRYCNYSPQGVKFGTARTTTTTGGNRHILFLPPLACI